MSDNHFWKIAKLDAKIIRAEINGGHKIAELLECCGKELDLDEYSKHALEHVTKRWNYFLGNSQFLVEAVDENGCKDTLNEEILKMCRMENEEKNYELLSTLFQERYTKEMSILKKLEKKLHEVNELIQEFKEKIEKKNGPILPEKGWPQIKQTVSASSSGREEISRKRKASPLPEGDTDGPTSSKKRINGNETE